MALALLLLLSSALAGCVARPYTAEQAPEYALPTSSAAFWRHIDAENRNDWLYALNTPQGAMEWRMRMIDSALGSIDMETFLWKFDDGGLRVLRHLLAAADRGRAQPRQRVLRAAAAGRTDVTGSNDVPPCVA